MIVSIAVAMSLDGKLTRHDEPDIRDWVSDEDQAFFRPLVAEHDVVIMGRVTYETIRAYLNLDLPVKRIVVTSTPERFSDQAIQGKLEFRSESSPELLKQLAEEDADKVLLVGGPQILGEAIRSKLVNYLHVTIEPRLFGDGVPFVDPVSMDCQLTLISHEQANPQGTLMLKYEVLTG